MGVIVGFYVVVQEAKWGRTDERTDRQTQNLLMRNTTCNKSSLDILLPAQSRSLPAKDFETDRLSANTQVAKLGYGKIKWNLFQTLCCKQATQFTHPLIASEEVWPTALRVRAPWNIVSASINQCSMFTLRDMLCKQGKPTQSDQSSSL